MSQDGWCLIASEGPSYRITLDRGVAPTSTRCWRNQERVALPRRSNASHSPRASSAGVQPPSHLLPGTGPSPGEIATSEPGYTSIRPHTCAPLAETLRLNGYSTAQFGQCHEVPVWETSPGGPFDAWPTGGGGFEYFYGFVAGETNQYYPALLVRRADPGELLICAPGVRCSWWSVR